jgi:hypothetical protein
LSRLIFSDDCPGCRPAMIDMQTGRPLSDDDPVMQAMNDVWAKTTYAERQSFHRFTCLGSMEPVDLMTIRAIQKRMHDRFAN